MSEKPENPPVFACAAENGHQEGILLRDYFAASALQGLLANPNLIHGLKICVKAYEIADNMLKTRKP